MLACLVLLVACTPKGGADLSRRERAVVLLQRGDAKQAARLFDEELAEHPDDLALARARCEAHVKAGQADALLSKLEADDSALGHYQKGLLRFSRAAEAAGPAIKELEAAVAAKPTEGEFHHRLGVALLESEQYEKALAPLKKAVELEPKHTGWKLPMAKALGRTGQTAAATKAVREAVEEGLTANEAKAAHALMDQLTDPFARFPREAQGKLEQGLQWLQVADVPQQAIISFEEILRDYPDLAVVHSLLGLAYQKLDDAGRAVDEFKRALELDPSDGKTHVYLGDLYLARQRPDQAREQYEKALDRNATLDSAWLRLGELALEKRDLSKARRCFKAATTLAPDAPAPRIRLAMVHQLDGDFPAAEKELKTALDKDPESLELQLRLGVLHAERHGRARTPAEKKTAATEAQKWLEKVLERQPDNAIASRALESVKQR